jgi:hypothetical protein
MDAVPPLSVGTRAGASNGSGAVQVAEACMPLDLSLSTIVAAIASSGLVAGCAAWLRNNGFSFRAGRLWIRWAEPKR